MKMITDPSGYHQCGDHPPYGDCDTISTEVNPLFNSLYLGCSKRF